MFDAPMDGLVVWVGLSLLSLSVAGIALSLPTAAVPEAGGVARAIDAVATSPHQVTTTVRVDASSIRIRRARLSLRGPGGTSHASLVAARPVPVGNGSLRRVLAGRAPADVFRSRGDFRAALAKARTRLGEWRPAPDRLGLRHVSWGAVDATLVG